MYTVPMKPKGFTVLEFLIVVAIMSILVGLILVGLNAARENARDQEKIANLQKVALGIEQYHDICREYPAELDPAQSCSNLNGAKLETLIPDLAKYTFNTGGDYNYIALSNNQADPAICSNFHLWVRLEKDRDTNAAHFDSAQTNDFWACPQSSPEAIDAFTDRTIYDIHK